MRRITVFTDEAAAATLVAMLEKNGYDFMSEDYAEPTIKRRDPPARRAEPERSEPSSSILLPTKKPALVAPAAPKPGRKPGPIRLWIEQVLRDQSEDDYDGIMKLACAERKKLTQVRDTLRRAVKSGDILLKDGVYTLAKGARRG